MSTTVVEASKQLLAATGNANIGTYLTPNLFMAILTMFFIIFIFLIGVT